MRWPVAIVVLGGCNAVFGLAPTSGRPDGGAGDPDARVAPDAAPTTETGLVGATSLDYTQDGSQVRGYGVIAQFGHPPRDCVELASKGECVTVRCTDNAAPPFPDAGDITISGNTDVLVQPFSDGTYPTTTNGLIGLFSDGQFVEYSAPGGEVPAFVETVQAPTAINFNTLALPVPGQPLTIDRGQDLTLSWGASTTGGNVRVGIIAGANTLSCNFPALAGNGVISKEVLGALDPGSGTMGSLVVSDVTFSDGAYAVTLETSVVARRLDGEWVNGPVTLQ